MCIQMYIMYHPHVGFQKSSQVLPDLSRWTIQPQQIDPLNARFSRSFYQNEHIQSTGGQPLTNYIVSDDFPFAFLMRGLCHNGVRLEFQNGLVFCTSVLSAVHPSLHRYTSHSCSLNQMVRPNECPMISNEAFNMNSTLMTTMMMMLILWTGTAVEMCPLICCVFVFLFFLSDKFSSVLQHHSACHQTICP